MVDTSPRYVIYSHLPSNKPPVGLLKEYRNSLLDLLNSKSGVLVFFYDPGWRELLNSNGLDFDPVLLSEEFTRAAKEEKNFSDELKHDTTGLLAARIRLVTARDLFPIINNLRGDRPGIEAIKLRHFLVGEHRRSLYDAPKVVEAILRVRHLGSGIPVFRVDWDVLFNEKFTKESTFFSQAVQKALDAHTEFYNDPRVYSFVYSGRYVNDAQLAHKPYTDWSWDNWLGAFATRLFPALVASEALLKTEGEVNPETLEANFDAGVAEAFYGLRLPDAGHQPVTLAIRTNSVEVKIDARPRRAAVNPDEPVKLDVPDGGITAVGANPTAAVISGALLCLSDGAILDLPPFSNFHLMVMWIDDHLKYALHRELGHLSYERPLNQNLTAQVSNCKVLKARAPVQNPAHYILGDYLPTLLWGTVMDMWIQPESCVKVQHLSKGQLRPGTFPQHLQVALEHGPLTDGQKADLRKTLRAEALSRIATVRDLWIKLVTTKDGAKSFAAAWVDPTYRKRLVDHVPKERKNSKGEVIEVLNDDWIGYGLFLQDYAGGEVTAECLAPAVRRNLDTLIEDAITYIDWTLEWPRFVQSVRSVPHGTIRLDVTWRPE